jgi:hypothetical protein
MVIPAIMSITYGMTQEMTDNRITLISQISLAVVEITVIKEIYVTADSGVESR